MQKYCHKEILSANQEYYNKIGRDYCKNERYAYSKEIIHDVEKNLSHYTSILSGKRYFLDFGCGSGFLSELIYRHNLFEFSAGIDISETQVTLFNNKFTTSNFRAFIADITNLPHRDDTFDMAGCYSVLHHVFDFSIAVKEVTRVLKPKGIIYIDFEPANSFRKLLFIPIKLRRTLIDKAPNNFKRLEYLSEYHHNIENGIHKEQLIKLLEQDYDILDVKPRYPHALYRHALRLLFRFSWVFAPYFYVVAQKKN